MKLFVVVGGHDYEGFGDHVGVFSSREKAQAALDAAAGGFDHIEIIEYVLDVAKGGLWK